MSDFREYRRCAHARLGDVSMIAGFEERYRAIEARDVRFDGQFVTAVRSTGIYCRPSCPARTPQRANVEFFATSAAAHEAGYRACKRCLPEAAPGSPQWNLRGDVVGRAMRLIADGVVEREGVPALAARLGYSSRHLTRLLTAELGAGPLALARAQRAHTARMLLVETDLPAADVAFSSGFASVRQFNATVREVFGMTPLQVRARRAGRESAAPGAIDLALPYREPMDADGVFAWMAARAIPGSRRRAPTPMPARFDWVAVPRGSGCVVTARVLRLEARLAHLGDLGALVTRVRRLFDLDADPVAIDAALAAHAPLAPLVAGVPGIRVPGASDPHEMLIRALVGQQVSVASARTALCAAHGGAGGADAVRARSRGHRIRASRRRDARAPLPDAGRDRRGRCGGAAGAGGARARDHGSGGGARLGRGRADDRRRSRGPACSPPGPAGHRDVDGRLRADAGHGRSRRVPARRSRGAPRSRGAGLPPRPGRSRSGQRAPRRGAATSPPISGAARRHRGPPPLHERNPDERPPRDDRHSRRPLHDPRRRAAARARLRVDDGRRRGDRPCPPAAAPGRPAGGARGRRLGHTRLLRGRPLCDRCGRRRPGGHGVAASGWMALRRIVPGEPLTYAAFARHLGQPAAVRAAASICARNAPALFVPCHRVLRSDGTLGGFAWGLAVKRSLLSREAV